jgi:hypothetical protein
MLAQATAGFAASGNIFAPVFPPASLAIVNEHFYVHVPQVLATEALRHLQTRLD